MRGAPWFQMNTLPKDGIRIALHTEQKNLDKSFIYTQLMRL